MSKFFAAFWPMIAVGFLAGYGAVTLIYQYLLVP